mgnify:CR=1 FL=1
MGSVVNDIDILNDIPLLISYKFAEYPKYFNYVDINVFKAFFIETFAFVVEGEFKTLHWADLGVELQDDILSLIDEIFPYLCEELNENYDKECG